MSAPATASAPAGGPGHRGDADHAGAAATTTADPAATTTADPAGTALAWLTRADLPDPGGAEGLLLAAPVAESVVALTPPDLTAALDLARATLTAAGVGARDRVVIALNSDGELGGALLAQAAGGVAAAVAAPGPRGRMRLFEVLRAVRASTLIATPTGAMDFLARLHLEFLVDPLDLGLRRIVLTGEIASPGTGRHLAAEFDAEVVEVYSDPVFGLPMAVSAGGVLSPPRPGLFGLTPLSRDELLTDPYPAGCAELVLTPSWHGALAGSAVRTGHVVTLGDGDAGIPAPTHTAGDQVLIRGRWVSFARLTQALARVDGIAHWELVIARSGTLDRATLRVTFNRASLTRNPMWLRRIEQALVAVAPVTIEVEIAEAVATEPRPPSLTDERGQHLGLDRDRVG